MVRRDSWRRVSATVAFLSLVGWAASAAADESGSPLELLQQALVDAESSLRLGETQIAESSYRTALFEGWLWLGSLARASGDLEEARSALEKAIDSAVDVRRARIALAGVLAQMEEFDEAEAVLRLLIAREKNDFEARRMLSDTLAQAGREEESIQELEQLVSMNPQDLETMFYLATAYLASDRPSEADFLLVRLAEAIPTPQTHILIGRTYRDYHFYPRARQAFETAIELDPRAPRAHYYRGTVDVLDQGRDLLEPAIGYFEKELEVNPGEPTASLYLGISLSEARRFEEALPHLEVAGGQPELRAEAFRFQGRCLASLGRTEEAIAAFRRGLDAAEVDIGDQPLEKITQAKARQIGSLHFQLAQALRNRGDGETAAIHFDAAKRYQSRSTESARETLAEYLTSESATYGENEFPLEKRSQAAVDTEQMEKMKGTVVRAMGRAYLDLGVLQARSGKPAAAADLFQQAADLDPELPRAQYSLGVARFNAGQFEEASGPLARALEERPRDEQLKQMLALAWFNAEEYGRAATALADLEARESNRALQYAYGVALVRGGRAEEAEEIFAALVAANDDWPELNVVLAQAHASQGDFETAVELLEQALALNPEVREAHGTLGEIHMRRGELEQAEEELRSELRAQPRDARTMFTLATVLDLAQKPDEAVALLRSLLDIEPRLAKGRSLLGKILLAQGVTEDALEQLEAAADLAPADANVHYQLGRAYQQLGRTEEARAEFDTFRRLKSESR